MNDKGSQCPLHRFFRPNSPRVGIGPVQYILWNSFYAVMEFFNRKLARNPYRKVSWDKWPKYFGLMYLMAKLRFNRSNALTDPYDYATNDNIDFKGVPDAGKRFYTADGTWVSDNNNPQMGVANTRFGSNIPPQRVRPDVENMEPSAREVGKLRWRKINPETGKEITVPALILNDLAGWWIQFQVHGFSGNTKRDPVSVCPHMMARQASDHWPDNVALIDRTTMDPTRITDNGRPTVINERTAAWIQAQFYGDNRSEETNLRLFQDGKFRLADNGHLPADPAKEGVDLTGFNNNFSAGLSFLHWLFVREHNSICDYLKGFHPDWDDETLFQMAKKVNVAQVARIHTVEWTKDLLQHPTLQLAMHADWYGFFGQKLKLYLMRLAYRHPFIDKVLKPLRNCDSIWGMPGSKWEHHDGPFQVPTQFRMVYRLHEMVLSEHEIIEPGSNRTLDRVALIDFVMHNTRSVVEKFGYETLAYSFVRKSAGALTLHNFPRALTQFHNQQDNVLTDLSERDIFRERTDGTGTYNEFRLSVGEPPVTSFLELTGGDVELANEVSLKYGGEIDKVDAGIGILVEPKPDGFALGFCQFYQFVLNAPRRVKSNRHLSEGYTYAGYEEGMNWVEHAGGILGVMARHLPGLKSSMEGVVRGFTPWPDTETFPLRLLNQSHADTGSVFKWDLTTLLFGSIALGFATISGVMSGWVAILIELGLIGTPLALAAMRMLTMRYTQQVWKKCYTDKRVFMIGLLEQAKTWIERLGFCSNVQALVVIGGFIGLAIASQSSHILVALVSGLVSVSGMVTWLKSRAFAKSAQILHISLKQRLLAGEVGLNELNSNCKFDFATSCGSNLAGKNVIADMIRCYAPGRDFLTAYDFSRMHEGNRVKAALSGQGNCFTRLVNEVVAKRQTARLLKLYADKVVEEDRHLVPAISSETLRNVCATELSTGLGWSETFEGGSQNAEDDMIAQWMNDIQKVQRENATAARSSGAQRAFHARSRLAVTNAEFRVSTNIPEFLRLGFLQPGQTYPTTVRLSNASGVPQSDTKRDLRGAALEVKLNDGSKQDFLLTNAAASHVRDAKQFIQFALAAAGGKLLLIPRLIGSVGFFEAIRILKTVIRQSSRPVASLATETFWSRAPFAFGPYALKFALSPAQSHEVVVVKGPNYLHEDLVERLKLGPIVYDFKVQLYVNDQLTPIEDGTVEWLEANSPFMTIGQLYIPAQDLTSSDALKTEQMVNNQAFNPWCTITSIRPLGSMNRARKLVYLASSTYRKGTLA